MTLLTFGDAGVDFGGTTILDAVSFTVDRGERWGIVGRNGAGKTTLLRLITGALEPSRGTVAKAGALRIVLLDQHRDFGAAATVWDAAAAGYAEAIALERRLAEQGERLARLGDRVTESDLARYGRDQERFTVLGGYDYHARVDAVLQGLGFDPDEAKTRPLESLSGGERGRVGLAGPLAAPADLLLLDEPTNHLDLETTRWLTRYVAELRETVLLVSHDRAFLDDTVDHVLHVHAGTVAAYRGGYSSFVIQRAERELSAQRAFDRQRAEIAKEEDYIRRNIAGQNTAQAKGRRRRLERLPRLSPPPGEAGAMAIRLDPGDRGGDRVLDTKHLRVTAGERPLLAGVTVTAIRGDCIALVGSNGAGKTTFLSTVLGVVPPAAGEARLGASITPAWYRQDLAGVPLGVSIYEVIHELRPGWNRGQIQGHLGAFGFSGAEVMRTTDTLSGGERARVALAMITLGRANFLVLDEPTNHLDIESIEVLEDAIEEYDGTVLLVSHDRAFLRELATRVWAIEGGRLEDFQGTFVEWEARRTDRERARTARQVEAAAEARAAKRTKAGVERRPADRGRAGAERLAAAERAVAAAETRVSELEAALADPALYGGTADGARKAGELARDLEQARREAQRAMAAWAEAAERADR